MNWTIFHEQVFPIRHKLYRFALRITGSVHEAEEQAELDDDQDKGEDNAGQSDGEADLVVEEVFEGEAWHDFDHHSVYEHCSV